MESATINKLEGELDCVICLSRLVDGRMLPCQHMLCKKCVDKVIDGHLKKHPGALTFDCPTCRHKCPIHSVDKFPTSLLARNLIEIIDEAKCSKQDSRSSCDVCGQKKHVVASCPQCMVYLCENCLARHVDKQPSHEVALISVVKECKEHPLREVEYYCLQCKATLCSVCSLQAKHDDHKVVDLEKTLNQIKEKITLFKSYVDPVMKIRKQIDEAAEKEVNNLKVSHQKVIELAQQYVINFQAKIEMLRLDNHSTLDTLLKNKGMLYQEFYDFAKRFEESEKSLILDNLGEFLSYLENFGSVFEQKAVKIHFEYLTEHIQAPLTLEVTMHKTKLADLSIAPESITCEWNKVVIGRNGQFPANPFQPNRRYACALQDDDSVIHFEFIPAVNEEDIESKDDLFSTNRWNIKNIYGPDDGRRYTDMRLYFIDPETVPDLLQDEEEESKELVAELKDAYVEYASVDVDNVWIDLVYQRSHHLFIFGRVRLDNSIVKFKDMDCDLAFIPPVKGIAAIYPSRASQHAQIMSNNFDNSKEQIQRVGSPVLRRLLTLLYKRSLRNQNDPSPLNNHYI